MNRPLKNRILTEIFNEYPFSISDIAVSYEWLRSYDALLAACEFASKNGYTKLNHYVTEKMMKTNPETVCLCGSTRFFEAFQRANLEETLAGRIVLTIGCDTKADGDLFGAMLPNELTELKSRLDELHLRKIDRADEVLILNVGGYIGESTRRELNYARAHGKRIRFLEPDKVTE